MMGNNKKCLWVIAIGTVIVIVAVAIALLIPTPTPKPPAPEPATDEAIIKDILSGKAVPVDVHGNPFGFNRGLEEMKRLYSAEGVPLTEIAPYIQNSAKDMVEAWCYRQSIQAKDWPKIVDAVSRAILNTKIKLDLPPADSAT